MRVIVTRPEISAHKTADRVRAMGHDPVLLPLFKPVHVPDTARAALRHRPSGLLLTSAEACRVLHYIPEATRPLLSLPVFAVGQATASAAAALGFSTVKVSGGGGEALAALVADEVGNNAGPLLYLAGEPRSPALEHGLEARHIPFQTAICYRMQATENSADILKALLHEPAAILFYSREATVRFLAILETDLPAGSILCCMSAHIAEALPAALRSNARIALEPTENAMLEMLPSSSGCTL